MQIKQARETYNVDHWSEGYFDISEEGEICAYPSLDPQRPIKLSSIVELARKNNLQLPILVRFQDILEHRQASFYAAFRKAFANHNYPQQYTAAYPIKVNQQRCVVEAFLKSEHPVGLEVGSKAELIAALTLGIYKPKFFICNGYKDREYLELALVATQLGHQVNIIIEKLSELPLLLRLAEEMQVMPRIGIRVRLASIGKGKWQNTGGIKSKFGLTATQLLTAVKMLRGNGKLSWFKVLHFFAGSQIADISDLTTAVREGMQYYVNLLADGVELDTLDVGGGIGVDYEGTRSRSYCSMNYSLDDYADNIVAVITEICESNNQPKPMIITESGRALAAHHAVLITNILELESLPRNFPVEIPTENKSVLKQMWQCWLDLNSRNVIEMYHKATQFFRTAQHQYQDGTLNLSNWAQAEQMFYQICYKAQEVLQPTCRGHRELIDKLNEILSHKVFVNFSIFQSLPDVWALDQIFPIVPITNLDQPCKIRGILQDLTCDSDGSIDSYVDGQSIEATLPLPVYSEADPYLLGFFLVGAYQEILGDMHNLFGTANALTVKLTEQGFEITQVRAGDTIVGVLDKIGYPPQFIEDSLQSQLSGLQLPDDLAAKIPAKIREIIRRSMYLNLDLMSKTKTEEGQ